jgi:NAD(P)-dependent dehydrogenase (short-subunit alcohol dehydrogenase family)
VTVPDHDPFRLDGQVALITGAARGLGLAIARTLGERGATVVLNGLPSDPLAAAAEELAESVAAVHVAAGDIADADAVASVVAEAHGIAGRLDILVNNAGIQVVKDLVDHTPAEWDRIIAVNLSGTFLTMHAALPLMIEARRGSVINMSSIAAFHTTTPHVAYAASKAAVHALTRDAAYEVAAYGVRVNAIAPGPIHTDMTDALEPSIHASVAAGIPVGRWGKPSEIGSAVAFLASAEAAFITGVTLPVTGGSDLRLKL